MRIAEGVYAGPIGDDAAGERVLALLAAHGLERGRVRLVPGARTAVTDILLEPGGERRFVREDYAIQESFVPSEEDWAWVARTGAVHSSRLPAELARLRALGRAGTHVSYDFTTDALPERLDGLSVAFVPDEALGEHDPAEAARALVERGAQCAVVTRGERGAVAATAEEVREVEAVPVVPVVDTCGAGDAFVAAFLARRLAGASLETCLAAGASGGAAACLHLGAIAQQGFALDDL